MVMHLLKKTVHANGRGAYLAKRSRSQLRSPGVGGWEVPAGFTAGSTRWFSRISPFWRKAKRRRRSSQRDQASIGLHGREDSSKCFP
eukprot:6182967-Pleurochrysis_carterae.AAC.1